MKLLTYSLTSLPEWQVLQSIKLILFRYKKIYLSNYIDEVILQKTDFLCITLSNGWSSLPTIINNLYT